MWDATKPPSDQTLLHVAKKCNHERSVFSQILALMLLSWVT